jgi:hypothetical protein
MYILTRLPTSGRLSEHGLLHLDILSGLRRSRFITILTKNMARRSCESLHPVCESPHKAIQLDVSRVRLRRHPGQIIQSCQFAVVSGVGGRSSCAAGTVTDSRSIPAGGARLAVCRWWRPRYCRFGTPPNTHILKHGYQSFYLSRVIPRLISLCCQRELTESTSSRRQDNLATNFDHARSCCFSG